LCNHAGSENPIIGREPVRYYRADFLGFASVLTGRELDLSGDADVAIAVSSESGADIMIPDILFA
jgi:hypothetical protein